MMLAGYWRLNLWCDWYLQHFGRQFLLLFLLLFVLMFYLLSAYYLQHVAKKPPNTKGKDAKSNKSRKRWAKSHKSNIKEPSSAYGSPRKTARKVMEIGCLTHICFVLLRLQIGIHNLIMAYHLFSHSSCHLGMYPIFRAPGTIVPRLLLTWRNCQLQTATNWGRLVPKTN